MSDAERIRPSAHPDPESGTAPRGNNFAETGSTHHRFSRNHLLARAGLAALLTTGVVIVGTESAKRFFPPEPGRYTDSLAEDEDEIVAQLPTVIPESTLPSSTEDSATDQHVFPYTNILTIPRIDEYTQLEIDRNRNDAVPAAAMDLLPDGSYPHCANQKELSAGLYGVYPLTLFLENRLMYAGYFSPVSDPADCLMRTLWRGDFYQPEPGIGILPLTTAEEQLVQRMTSPATKSVEAITETHATSVNPAAGLTQQEERANTETVARFIPNAFVTDIWSREEAAFSEPNRDPARPGNSENQSIQTEQTTPGTFAAGNPSDAALAYLALNRGIAPRDHSNSFSRTTLVPVELQEKDGSRIFPYHLAFTKYYYREVYDIDSDRVAVYEGSATDTRDRTFTLYYDVTAVRDETNIVTNYDAIMEARRGNG